MNAPITVIEKNAAEEIRVVWGEYRGKALLNVRIFTDLPNRDERMPTRKGITLANLEQTDVLIAALQAARGDFINGE